MKRIAIITARSGSKGLKNKNILPLGGKPLLAYSAEAAVQSGKFDRVILSTDSDEYGKIGEEYGAEYIRRSEEASKDTASTYIALKEVLKLIGTDFDYFMLFQPTSPFRNAQHVVEACDLYEKRMGEFDFLVSMKEVRYTPELTNPIEDDLSLKYFDTDFSSFRRQDKKKFYTPNGAIYIAKPEAYLDRKHFYGAKSMAYIMDEVSSVDIDGPLDFEFAELLMKKGLNER